MQNANKTELIEPNRPTDNKSNKNNENICAAEFKNFRLWTSFAWRIVSDDMNECSSSSSLFNGKEKGIKKNNCRKEYKHQLARFFASKLLFCNEASIRMTQHGAYGLHLASERASEQATGKYGMVLVPCNFILDSLKFIFRRRLLLGYDPLRNETLNMVWARLARESERASERRPCYIINVFAFLRLDGKAADVGGLVHGLLEYVMLMSLNADNKRRNKHRARSTRS